MHDVNFDIFRQEIQYIKHFKARGKAKQMKEADPSLLQ